MNFFKVLGVNLITILIVVFLIVTGIAFILKGYTRHGQALTVPDVRGLKIDDAIRVLEGKNLRCVVSDSLYFEDKPKLSVLEQNPVAESSVKEGRMVYITINTNAAPKITLPNVLDVSLRQAEAMLLSAGLKIGKFIYKPDIAKDVVLDVRYMNTSVQPGKKIDKGTTVDLVLGDGLQGEETDMPDLSGLSLEEARNLLQSSSLNLGSVVYTGAITDSSEARVVRQNPAYTEGATIKAGQPIDLFMKQ
jgi:eukaryotic-like serine/threonine-protein kinase